MEQQIYIYIHIERDREREGLRIQGFKVSALTIKESFLELSLEYLGCQT